MNLYFVLRYLCIALLFSSVVFASQSETRNAFNTAQISVNKLDSAPSQIRFAEGKEATLETFWQGYAQKFSISADNEFRAFAAKTDNLGQTHHRYKQYYKGVEVADMQYILHEKNGRVHLANGKIVHSLNISITPTLSESEALQYALDQLGAEEYMWENSKNEMFRKKLEQDKKATYYPGGTLMISKAGKKAEAQNFKLVYRFDIYAHKPSFGYTVDVDAHSGKILNKIPLILHGDVQGNGNSLYDGNVSIIVSDADYPLPPQPEAPEPHWQLDGWNAYGGDGVSWRPFDPAFGDNGGYANGWYEIMDTDPVALTGSGLQLSFYHRHSIEAPDGASAPFNGWDGMNIRISTDGGENWTVLADPSPAYDNSSLFSFGDLNEGFGEGPDIPGWTGSREEWTQVTHDLSAYAGQTVQIRFAFASDLGFSTEDGGPQLFGWQVDNIELSNSEGTLYSNFGDTSTVTLASNMPPAPPEVTEISGNYRLRESGRASGIFTYNLVNSVFFADAVDFVDDDSSFTDPEDAPGVSMHWGLEKTYDFFMDVHGRDSYDDAAGRLKGYSIPDYNNASWNGLFMIFDPIFTSLDIVGHELTHGVTDYSADLIYQSEYGALNESFSDIFAGALVYWQYGEYDWLIGGDLPSPLRSMSNPNDFGDPDTYAGDGWVDTDPNAFDNGGVHINSGVQNHWFYLLVEGGSGANDNGLTYNVQGIGWDDAQKIAYRNLTVYLTPTSEYADAREGAVNAAIDLFGSASQQVESVKQAWNAVGVAPAWAFSVLGTGIDGHYFKAGEGSVNVAASISNPSDINIEVNAIIENISKSVSDTVAMFDDGAHNDSSASDNVYGTSWTLPAEQDFFFVNVQIFSPDSNYAFLLRDIDRFTSVGPVILENFEQTTGDTVAHPGDTRRFNFYIQNSSPSDTIFNITTKSYALDTCALTIAFSDPAYGDIAPGASAKSSRSTSILFYQNCPVDITIPFVVEIYSDDYLFWADTFYITTSEEVTGIANESIPLEFALRQNYPNPFNPETVINYSLPNAGKVDLAVFDITGKLVQTLVKQNQPAGNYSVVFDARKLPSGVYFYRIRSGHFEQSRKMILIK